jgi:predicted dienelactone hydrolase
MTRHPRGRTWVAGLCLLCGAAVLGAPSAPSIPPIDAPELAALGPLRVGVRSVHLVDRDQYNVLATDKITGHVPRDDRPLQVELWYPARPAAQALPETYRDVLPAEPPAPPAAFEVAGIAVRDAPPIAGRYPLVIVSHGYSNVPVALSWLTENLASKGYVVAAIRHDDPLIGDRSTFAGPLLRRPLDIAFVARELSATLAADGSVDPTRVALVGYSMGGYGVLTAGGARLDPAGPAHLVPGGVMLPYADGGRLANSIVVPHLKAVVALAPAGGGTLNVWGEHGLEHLTAPLLLIAGDHDLTVDYASGARAFFDRAVHAPRYLLTFLGGGHGIGLDPAPASMRDDLWNFSWFEDPLWRKDKILAINTHMITAFLDRYVKDEDTRSAYLDGLVPRIDDTVWPAELAPHFDMTSAAEAPVTLWKGFKRRFSTGLEWHAAPAEPAPSASALTAPR